MNSARTKPRRGRSNSETPRQPQPPPSRPESSLQHSGSKSGQYTMHGISDAAAEAKTEIMNYLSRNRVMASAVIDKSPKPKSKKKHSKLGMPESSPVARNQVDEAKTTMKSSPASTKLIFDAVDSTGDTDSELLKLTKEDMLQHIAFNAREVIGHPKVFPLAVIPKNSMSTIEINYQQMRQDLLFSDRYAQHGGKSPAEKMATVEENNTPQLSPVARRITPRPKSKETRPGSRKPALGLRNLLKSVSLTLKPLVKPKVKPLLDGKTLPLSNDVKAAVAAISQLSRQEKTKTQVSTLSRAQSQRSATGSVSAMRKGSSSSSRKRTSATRQKGKRKSLADAKAKEIVSQSQITEMIEATSATSCIKAPVTLNSAHRKRPTTTGRKPITKTGSLSPSRVFLEHKLIEHQWNHVLERQVLLEAEVLQLLGALQGKVSQNNNLCEEKPCCCDSETREQLEGVVRKQKEVIQLQIDLHQRYGLHQFRSATTFGKSRPILNAFEAHYDQLSAFAREMNGKMMYYCPPCNFAAKDELAFRIHLESSGHVVRTYQGIIKHQPSFSCEHCSQQFSGTTKYLSHIVFPEGKGGANPKCKQDNSNGENPKPKKFSDI